LFAAHGMKAISWIAEHPRRGGAVDKLGWLGPIRRRLEIGAGLAGLEFGRRLPVGLAGDYHEQAVGLDLMRSTMSLQAIGVLTPLPTLKL